MDSELKKVIEGIKKIGMTPAERVQARQKLLSAMQTESAQEISKPSSYTTISIWHLFSESRNIYVALTCLIAVVLSGGVALAAEGALPGDALYGVKTGVNENVLRAWHSASPVASADFETEIMQRRLTEAEELDKEQKLNDVNKVIVQKNILAQEGRVEEAVVRLLTVASSTDRSGGAIAGFIHATTTLGHSKTNGAGTSENKNKNKSKTQKENGSGTSVSNDFSASASVRVNNQSNQGKDNAESDNSTKSSLIETNGESDDNTIQAENTIEEVNTMLRDHQDIINKIGSHDSFEHDGGENSTDN